MTKDLAIEIKEILTKNLNLSEIEVENESHKHAGHREAGEAINSHFKITALKSEIEGSNLINKHKSITNHLKHWMNNPIHAVEIKLK